MRCLGALAVSPPGAPVHFPPGRESSVPKGRRARTGRRTRNGNQYIAQRTSQTLCAKSCAPRGLLLSSPGPRGGGRDGDSQRDVLPLPRRSVQAPVLFPRGGLSTFGERPFPVGNGHKCVLTDLSPRRYSWRPRLYPFTAISGCAHILAEGRAFVKGKSCFWAKNSGFPGPEALPEPPSGRKGGPISRRTTRPAGCPAGYTPCPIPVPAPGGTPWARPPSGAFPASARRRESRCRGARRRCPAAAPAPP